MIAANTGPVFAIAQLPGLAAIQSTMATHGSVLMQANALHTVTDSAHLAQLRTVSATIAAQVAANAHLAPTLGSARSARRRSRGGRSDAPPSAAGRGSAQSPEGGRDVRNRAAGYAALGTARLRASGGIESKIAGGVRRRRARAVARGSARSAS